MNTTIKNVKVKYNGKIIGYLAEIEPNVIGFQYDNEWLQSGFSISPFSLPLTSEVFINRKMTFNGLYGVFWDSLPDGWGELLVKRLLAKRGINVDTLSPLTKLTLISKNGLGGLEYEPSQAVEAGTLDFNLDEISKEVDAILNDDTVYDLDRIYQLGGSSGGARPKAHIRIDDADWIVKFGCRIDPPNVGEKEYATNQLAKQCGINVNNFALFPSKLCSGYYGAKRFDRVDNKRKHVISLSALLETTHRIPNLDYIHLFYVIQEISAQKEKDLYEAFRRMCFNVFFGNKDDHGKNFAFIYDEKIGGYILSPAFDLTQTPDKVEHEMTVNGAGNPRDDDILVVAQKFKLSLSKCKDILATIKKR